MNEKNMRVARGENHSCFHVTADNNSIKALSRNTHKRTALLTVSLTNSYNPRRKKLRKLTRGVTFIRQAVANGENCSERSLSVMRYSHFFHFPTTSSFYVTFIQALIDSVTTTLLQLHEINVLSRDNICNL